MARFCVNFALSSILISLYLSTADSLFTEKTGFARIQRATGTLRACLTIQGTDSGSDADILILPCIPFLSLQMWQQIVRSSRPDGPVHVRVEHNEKCLSSDLSGRGLFAAICKETDLQQQWIVRRNFEVGGFVRLENEFAQGRCLDVDVEDDIPTPVLNPCGGGGLRQVWIWPEISPNGNKVVDFNVTTDNV